MRRSFGFAMGGAAILIEALSLYVVLDDPGPGSLTGACVLHLVSVSAAFVAARIGGARGAREFDAVIVTALVIPLFGPALAWMMPVRSDAEAEASQAMLEEVDNRMGHAEDYTRPFFLGDFEKDLARQVNAVSYYEVLEKGDLEQKRDALRKLARLGEPRHMALVTRALEDEDTELRLCAYLELDRVRQRHERAISEVQDQVRAHVAWAEWLDAIVDAPLGEDGRPDLAEYPPPSVERESLELDLGELRARLAQGHLDYAISGTLDTTMRDFRLDRCLEECAVALAEDASNVRALVISARAHCERTNLETAEETLALLPADAQEHRSILVLRARIRFDANDFEGARMLGYRVLETRQDPPEWLLALCAEHPPADAFASAMQEELVG